MPSYKNNLPQNPTLINPITGTASNGQVAYFNGTSTLTGSNNLYWDAVNNRLSVGGITNPQSALTINSLATLTTGIRLENGSSIGYIFGDGNAMNIRAGSTYGITINGSSSGLNSLNQSAGSFRIELQTFTTIPLYTFNSDADTGIGRNAADTLTFFSGGERARFDSSGNFVIGTTAASARLHVRGTGTTSSTTALLVQNSTPTNLLSITDNGQVNVTPTTLTGSEATSAIDIQQTWNTTGTPTLIKANVTDTASIASSLLMDLQVGGSSRFRVAKNGVINVNSTVRGIFPISGIDINTASGPNGGFAFKSSMSGATGWSFQFADGAASSRTAATNPSGNINANVVLGENFAPNTGIANYAQLFLNFTINQTGGANGITRGLYVNPTLTAAADWRSIEWSNNTGWGLYGAGTANNYLGGRLGLNSSAITNVTLRNELPISGSTSSFGYYSNAIVQSSVTTYASYLSISPQTATATFTLSRLNVFEVGPLVLGAGSTVTEASAFYGNIAVGTGRWNLYMNGTAANYLAGNTAIGTTTTSGGRLTVRGSGTTSSTTALLVQNSTPTNLLQVLDNGRISQTLEGALNNTAFGTNALSVSTGNYNIAFGGDTLQYTTSGLNNNAFGFRTLRNNTTGINNTAFGHTALNASSTASNNTAFGSQSGLNTTTGANNTFIGGESGLNTTTGTNNSFLGLFSGYSNISGNNNTALGFGAGRYAGSGTTANQTSSNSIYIGYQSRAGANGNTNEVVIGYNVVGLGSNTTTIGNASTTQTHLYGNLTLGTTTSGGRLTVRGSGTTSSTTALLVQNSTPTNLLQVLDNGRISQTLEGSTGSTAFGTSALSVATGIRNTAFGSQTGRLNTTGNFNSFFGFEAGYNNTTGTGNSFFGQSAGYSSTTSDNNVYFGLNASYGITSGQFNVTIGSNAGRFITDDTTNLTIANNSIFIGYRTKANADNETNQIVIGYQTTGNGSNTTTIGNTSTTDNYIYGNFNITDKNIIFGTTTGTKIGTATSQKLAFYGATPIVQVSTSVAAATLVGGGGTTITDTDTFGGYTLQQIAQALKDYGLLA